MNQLSTLVKNLDEAGMFNSIEIEEEINPCKDCTVNCSSFDYCPIYDEPEYPSNSNQGYYPS